MIANHGRKAKYDHSFEGRNSRLDALQAAVLSLKLKHLESWTEKRILIAERYIKELSGIKGLILPKREKWSRQVYHLFVIRVSDRQKLRNFLDQKNIQTGVHYPIALPKLEAYKYLNIDLNSFVACSQDKTLLSLPIGEHLTTDDINQVISAIKTYF